MPRASIIVPAFNVADTIADTLKSLQRQSFTDFEVLIVDDGSTDTTADVARPFLQDSRFTYLRQANRGLAGARNSGIAAARGGYIGFCDADDIWAPDKLRLHVRHLDRNPRVGVSYAGSYMIDETGRTLGARQTPRLSNLRADHILKRNPIGNGSAAILRREVFDDIAFHANSRSLRKSYFDETFRQSEDIECWVRIALTTDWQFEGIRGHLTGYRIAASGLSANTERQLASWENAIAKLRPVNPFFFDRHEAAARAYQLRYLARRAISGRDGLNALHYMRRALASSLEPLWAEPAKTLTTSIAAAMGPALAVVPAALPTTSSNR